jgi:hypothetical protein
MDKIVELSKKYNFGILEDCSQSHETRYKGNHLGSYGDMAVYSLYPGKNLGAAGDAGIITTNSDELNVRLRSLRKETKIVVDLGNDEDTGEEADEGDNDGKAAMIASAGDDGEEPDLKARSVASTSSLHTYRTDDDVDDLGTDDVNDLVGKLIKKAMEVKSKKSSKLGSTKLI